MFTKSASSRFFTVLLLAGAAFKAHALEIAGVTVNQPFDYVAPVAGRCLDMNGLACGWQEGDPLLDPTTGAIANPLPSGVAESPEWTRDAIYTATGVDPGQLVQAAKVDGSQSPNLNGESGLTLYTELGEVMLDTNIGNAGYMQGFWSYSGSLQLEYLAVKPGKQAIVWDIESLIIGGPNDTDPSTVMVGYWELNSAYNVLTGFTQNEMSHISVYAIDPDAPPPPSRVPAPGALILLLSGLGALAIRRRRRL